LPKRRLLVEHSQKQRAGCFRQSRYQGQPQIAPALERGAAPVLPTMFLQSLGVVRQTTDLLSVCSGFAAMI
jgi:hypothetical protein